MLGCMCLMHVGRSSCIPAVVAPWIIEVRAGGYRMEGRDCDAAYVTGRIRALRAAAGGMPVVALAVASGVADEAVAAALDLLAREGVERARFAEGE